MPTLCHRLLRLVVIAAAISLVGGPSAAADDVFGNVDPLGVAHIYKTVGGRELRIHIVNPPDWQPTDRRAAVVFFHGGSWTSGRPVQFNEHSRYFATRGLVCAQVEYRLLDPASQEPPTVCVQDAKSALRWVRTRAQALGIDDRRIAAAGGSAGGHLAAFVGMVDGLDDPRDDRKISARANALVLFNPVFDNGPDQGWGTARVRERFREFSPAHNITPDDPPAIIFVGTKDKLIPVDVVRRFAASMTKAGVRCDTIFYEGQEHGFFNLARGGPKYFGETVVAADKFLASLGWLQGPPTLR